MSCLLLNASSELGFGDPDTLSGGITSGNIAEDTIRGIANNAIGYGADKLFGNQASWNLGNVAVDAFGKVLGNSIVAGVQSKQTQGQTGHFDLSSVNTVQEGYNMIGYLSDHLRGTPNMGMMLGMATNQIIGQTQRHHDALMNSIQHLDIAKYKLGGTNGVFDRPVMYDVSYGPWASALLDGSVNPSPVVNPLGQPGPWAIPTSPGPWAGHYAFHENDVKSWRGDLNERWAAWEKANPFLGEAFGRTGFMGSAYAIGEGAYYASQGVRGNAISGGFSNNTPWGRVGITGSSGMANIYSLVDGASDSRPNIHSNYLVNGANCV